MAKKNEVEEQTTIEKLDSNLGSASEKIAANKKIIFWVVGGIAVVAAFALSYIFIYRNPQLNKGYEAYNEVEIKAQGNDSIAAAEYKKVADQFSGDPASLAALSAAESYYEQKKYKEALECLNKFSTSEPVLEANALVMKGDCQVNLKQYDAAIDSFNSAISKADKNPQIVPRVLMKLANIYDAQKKYDKALTCYEDIKANYPEFQAGQTGIGAYIDRENERLGK